MRLNNVGKIETQNQVQFPISNYVPIILSGKKTEQNYRMYKSDYFLFWQKEKITAQVRNEDESSNNAGNKK